MTMKISIGQTLGVVAVAVAMGATPGVAQEDGCVTSADANSLAGRASPLDSIAFTIDGHTVRVCFGRPSAKERTMIGGSAVPFGRLWRTGANEPAMIHTPVALSVGGVEIGPGTYSFYTVPNESEWGIILNRSYEQWGHEGQYTPEVEAQEVGRGSAPASQTEEHVEQFSISYSAGHLVLRWETTEVKVPISMSS